VEREPRAVELKRIADAAALAAKNGVEPHAGHGLTFDNVIPVAAIPQIAELNIGHFLVGEAIFTGLEASVKRMRALIESAR
jgi:pyridoxine 5-phosphate synthase